MKQTFSKHTSFTVSVLSAKSGVVTVDVTGDDERESGGEGCVAACNDSSDESTK